MGVLDFLRGSDGKSVRYKDLGGGVIEPLFALDDGTGNPLTPGAATIADGANVVEGAVNDVMVGAGSPGTISGKLRRISQALEDLKTLTVLAAGTNVIGGVTVADGSDVGQGAKANAAATDSTSAWSVISLLKGVFAQLASLVALRTPTTGTQSSVAGSASSASLLISNASRKGATIYNDSSADLYLKLGATASTTSFSALLKGNGSGAGGYYEVPFGYTGAIDGIWATAAGSARVTELT